MHKDSEIYWNSDRKMQLLFAGLGFAVFFALLYYLADVLVPFAISFLLAYILNPLVNILQKKVKYRFIAAILILFTLLIICVGAFLIFIPMIIEQGAHLGRLVQKFVSDNALKENVMNILPNSVLEKIQYIWNEKDFYPVLYQLQNLDVLKIGQSILEKVVYGAAGIFSGVSKLFGWFFVFFIIALCLVFMLLDFENLRKKMAEQIPAKHSKIVLHFFGIFDNIMSKYFRAQTSIAAIVGVLFAT
jgi:predicted PurR-regulated permease PerM